MSWVFLFVCFRLTLTTLQFTHKESGQGWFVSNIIQLLEVDPEQNLNLNLKQFNLVLTFQKFLYCFLIVYWIIICLPGQYLKGMFLLTLFFLSYTKYNIKYFLFMFLYPFCCKLAIEVLFWVQRGHSLCPPDTGKKSTSKSFQISLEHDAGSLQRTGKALAFWARMATSYGGNQGSLQVGINIWFRPGLMAWISRDYNVRH